MAHARACLMGLLFLTLAGGAMADPVPATPADLSTIFKAFDSNGSAQEPSYGTGDGGYIQHIVALDGATFNNDSALAKNAFTPGAAAIAFMEEHKAAFGVKTNRASFDIISEEPTNSGTMVKVQQLYDTVPVFGGQFNIRLDSNNDVKSIISDPMRDTAAFDQNYIRTIPTLDAQSAVQDAVQSVIAEYGGGSYNASQPQQLIYDPSIAGTAGEPRLAYRTQIQDATDHTVHQDVFVDAHSGSVLLSYSLMCTAKNRYVYDLRNAPNAQLPGFLERVEGGPVSNVAAVNTVFDMVGETYDFYTNEHSRDGLDNGGGLIRTSVRLPQLNAFWTGTQIVIGTQFLTDDIVAHEYTHGVTQFTSNLVYLFESGAINESLSDMWGEFVDLTNTRGDDSDEVRWLVGEDSGVGAIRSMSDPTLFGDPDRYSELVELQIFQDNGGVHINSGIGNKLCFLLTDGTGGEEFNGFEVDGMGISRVADLFYDAQLFELTPLTDYQGLYFALLASADNLNWSFVEKVNLVNACKAVEIFQLPDEKPLRHLRAQSEANTSSITVTWKNPNYPSNGTTIVRRTDRFPEAPNDGTVIIANTNNEFVVDNNVSQGQRYYYGAFAIPVDLGPEVDHAQAVAGEGLPEYFTEEFTFGNDLSFSQIFYSPVGDLTQVFNSGKPAEYATFHHYDATFRTNVQQLPVRRINGVTLNLPDNEVQLLPEFYIDQPIYFFGRLMDRVLVSGNGFVTPADVLTQHFFNVDPNLPFPSLFSHWDVPRLSALFNDLIPAAAGEIWAETLPDRIVITFDKVREFNATFPPPENTFQIEMFYSGHIRITYLALESRAFIAGLSDGRGEPIAPSDVGDPFAVPQGTNLDASPPEGILSIQPITASIVAEGDLVAFQVVARSAQAGAITLTGSNLPGGASFNTATGVFTWRPGSGDAGVYQPLFTATQGQSVSTQTALIIVNDLALAPSASNIVLSPMGEVEDDQEINVTYDYSSPDGQAEGFSELFWFRNGFSVSALFNSQVVPPEATEVGDMYSFVVVPRDSRGLRGQPLYSDEIFVVPNTKADINEDGKVDSVDIQLVINAVLSKGIGALSADANIDGLVNSIDIQTVINKVLR